MVDTLTVAIVSLMSTVSIVEAQSAGAVLKFTEYGTSYYQTFPTMDAIFGVNGACIELSGGPFGSYIYWGQIMSCDENGASYVQYSDPYCSNITVSVTLPVGQQFEWSPGVTAVISCMPYAYTWYNDAEVTGCYDMTSRAQGGGWTANFVVWDNYNIGAVCLPSISQGGCPTRVPPGVTAVPQPAIEVPDIGDPNITYCALVCSNDDECGPASPITGVRPFCQSVSFDNSSGTSNGKKICLYNDQDTQCGGTGGPAGRPPNYCTPPYNSSGTSAKYAPTQSISGVGDNAQKLLSQYVV